MRPRDGMAAARDASHRTAQGRLHRLAQSMLMRCRCRPWAQKPARRCCCAVVYASLGGACSSGRHSGKMSRNASLARIGVTTLLLTQLKAWCDRTVHALH
jgi:hypothetical protein